MKTLDAVGNQVLPTDPARLVWYSALCGYWTDDWSKLKLHGPGIPCCPECGCPGMKTNAGDWDRGVARFEEDNPGYADFLSEHKETCLKDRGGMMKVWKEVTGG